MSACAIGGFVGREITGVGLQIAGGLVERTALLESPHIDRLNLGPTPTNRVQWDQPHEGNLFEFLYKRRSIGVPQELAA